MKTIAATSQSMKTCFVTEKSIPNTCGSEIRGSSWELFETCSMIVLPASNFSLAGAPAGS
jgi:hypothetical protein